MIYPCEHHEEALVHWRARDLRDLSLVHVDFHDDLRGLLIDRRRSVAYPIGSLAGGQAPLDAGNFLAHAVLERRVRRVRWIHGTVGGRAWDSGIVRYESDLFAAHYRLRQRISGLPEIPLEFEESLLEEWDGLDSDDPLSIDWDCFASILQEPVGIDSRVTGFLERLGPAVPRDTYLCYSPEYSHPTLESFRGLVQTLAERFGQGVEWLRSDFRQGKLNPTDVQAGPPEGLLMRFILMLRRNGIY